MFTKIASLTIKAQTHSRFERTQNKTNQRNNKSRRRMGREKEGIKEKRDGCVVRKGFGS